MYFVFGIFNARLEPRKIGSKVLTFAFKVTILCSEILIISNKCFSRNKKLCKSSKCFDKEAILRWSSKRERCSVDF